MIDLQPFCSIDETRMAINTPFVFNCWKYATDGRIAIRIPSTEPDDSNDPYKRPNAEALFKSFNTIGLESFDIPALAGVKIITCDWCSGLGYANCDMGLEHECNNCDGGSYEEWPKAEVGGITFSERFLYKLSPLPDVKLYPTVASWLEGNPATPAFFTFGDNGQGLIMPMRKESK